MKPGISDLVALHSFEYLGGGKTLQKRWSYHMIFLKKQKKNQKTNPKT